MSANGSRSKLLSALPDPGPATEHGEACNETYETDQILPNIHDPCL
jgi:hypothetical protein